MQSTKQGEIILVAVGMCLPSVCLFCKNADESIDQLFLQYTFAERIWDWLSGISCWLTPCPKGISNPLQQICTPPFASLGIDLWRIVVADALWSPLKERNLRTFEGCSKDLSFLIDSIKRSSIIVCNPTGSSKSPFILRGKCGRLE
ncbi:hypothetical protein AMTRI_Chr13g86650 [Amborella trichopoda]